MLDIEASESLGVRGCAPLAHVGASSGVARARHQRNRFRLNLGFALSIRSIASSYSEILQLSGIML